MEFISPKPAKSSSTYNAANLIKLVQGGVVALAAISTLELGGLHPLRILGLSDQAVLKIQAASALATGLMGIKSYMDAETAKQGRIDATQPIYEPGQSKPEEPTIRPETEIEKGFFDEITRAAGQGVSFLDAVKQYARKETY